MKITTKRGDHGRTTLYDGAEVGKDDARVELNGVTDEANALLGLCKVATGEQEPFATIQRQLVDFMAIVARGGDAEKLKNLEGATIRMEAFIEKAGRGRKFELLLPGRDEADAILHLTRAKIRTCERRLVELMRVDDSVSPALLIYLNRLSDFLFGMIVTRK